MNIWNQIKRLFAGPADPEACPQRFDPQDCIHRVCRVAGLCYQRNRLRAVSSGGTYRARGMTLPRE